MWLEGLVYYSIIRGEKIYFFVLLNSNNIYYFNKLV